MNLSFSGCGFIGFYHLGVVECLRERAPHLLRHVDRVYGASAGSLAGAILVTNTNVAKVIPRFFSVISRLRTLYLGPFSPSFDMLGELDDSLELLLPANAHKLANDRLHVSLTVINESNRMENVIVKRFTSKRDLIQALKASCFIPVFGGYRAPRFRGRLCMDGGFTDNLPGVDKEHTISVSPFGGESDICPDDSKFSASMYTFHVKNLSFQMSLSNLRRLSLAIFPQEKEEMNELRLSGYRDCLKYLQRKDVSARIDDLILSEKNNVTSSKCTVYASASITFETSIEVYIPDSRVVSYYPSASSIFKESATLQQVLSLVKTIATKGSTFIVCGAQVMIKGSSYVLRCVGHMTWQRIMAIRNFLEDLLSPSDTIKAVTSSKRVTSSKSIQADCRFRLIVWT